MNKWKKRIAAVLAAAVTVTGIFPGIVKEASAQAYDRREAVAWDEINLRASANSKVSSKAWKKINGICYNGSGVKIDGAITRGMDVSSWNGKINWKKVKNSDIDFAFVRISAGLTYPDSAYDYNMKQAEEAGVPVGTYVYSHARTNEQALKEAQYAISKMKGYKVSYPVAYDAEASYIAELGPKKASELVITFCNEIKKAGYYPILYTNGNWYNNVLDMSMLTDYEVWLAWYGDTISAPSHSNYRYTIWQCTDGYSGGILNPTKGMIDGLPADVNVDLNFGFVDYTKKIVPRKASLASYHASASPDIPNKKNGWEEANGSKYYYVNGVKATGWKEIDGKYYFFNTKTGKMYKSYMISASKPKYYYVNKYGERVKNKWITWKGKKYYMGADGAAVKGLKKIGGKYYCFNTSTGYMYKDKKIISSAGNIYYTGSDGICCTNGFCKIKEGGKTRTYYFGSNARAYKGWHTINGKKYYFYKGNTKDSGVRAENTTLTSAAGIVSVFDKNGVCIKQYQKDSEPSVEPDTTVTPTPKPTAAPKPTTTPVPPNITEDWPELTPA